MQTRYFAKHDSMFLQRRNNFSLKEKEIKFRIQVHSLLVERLIVFISNLLRILAYFICDYKFSKLVETLYIFILQRKKFNWHFE